MSEYSGRSRGMRGGRSRGGFPSRGFRGSGRGFSDRGRGGYSRGRGDGYSRGRGGPMRSIRDDDSPPRKSALMSRDYESRDRPPMSRRDKFDDSYDRGSPPSRSRDLYSSPPRESSRLMDRPSPPPARISSRGGRDYGSREYTSSRGEYMSARSYSPVARDSGYSSHRDSYRTSIRDDDRDGFARPSPRDYPSKISDYSDRPPREYRDSPREYGASRDYPPSRSSDFRSSMGSRGDYISPRERVSSRDSRNYENGREFQSRSFSERLGPGERDYGSSRMSKLDDRSPIRVSREYRGRGGPRGGFRGGRDDSRGGYMNGRGSRGPPRGRGRPDFSSRGGSRRSPPSSRDGPPRKAPRMEGSDSYRR